MFDNVFGIHEQALLLHGQRLSVLANNLANADTPGFKARDIDFAEALAGADGEIALTTSVTNPEHISVGEVGYSPAILKYRNPFQASLDGNTVEMPMEQAAFADNNVRYQASLAFINGRIAELQYVISGQ